MVDMDVAIPDTSNYDLGDQPIPDGFLDDTMQKAITQHSRKESQIASIENDFSNLMDANTASNIASNLIGFMGNNNDFIAYDNDEDEKDRNIQHTVNRVMKTHKRKVSQFESLKQELGLVFDEEEAARIAKKTMKELNPNNANVQQIQIKNIVNRARKEHKRKVSQFEAIKSDLSQYFPSEEESIKLAAEIMKEYNPNNRSGKSEEISIDSIVKKAVTEHKRKISVFRSVENDLGLIFDDKDVKNITKDVMKKIFAQKHTNETTNTNNKRRGSQVYLDDDSDNQVYVDKMKQRIQELQNKLYEKDKKIEMMEKQIQDMTVSKNNLVINTNQALDEMRGYLLEYQQSIFKKNS
eukprot:157430_1